ncbi:hypothetical protein Hanom_Chr10g00919441 [Helianthus anomalus]
MNLYRVRFFDELDRLSTSKMYLHFINMKCFSYTGFNMCLNESKKRLIPKKQKLETCLHRNLRWSP